MRKLLTLLLGLSAAAMASIITDASQLPLGSLTVPFSGYSGPNAISTTSIPIFVNLNGVIISFSSTNPDGSYIGDRTYDLGVNGVWGGSSTVYAGVDFDLFGGDAYSITFTYSTPISAVLFLLNYRIPTQEEADLGISYSPPTIEALGAGGTVLESYDLSSIAPISTPGGSNVGAFRGFLRNAADIVAIRLSNAGIVITDMSIFAAGLPKGGENEIPEPSSLLLAGAGLGILALSRRSSRRR